VDLSRINWKKGQPQYKANGCLGVFFPFINRTIGKQIAPPPSTPRVYNYLLVPNRKCVYFISDYTVTPTFEIVDCDSKTSYICQVDDFHIMCHAIPKTFLIEK
jgi:hypothetical protein